MANKKGIAVGFLYFVIVERDFGSAERMKNAAPPGMMKWRQQKGRGLHRALRI
ncbi:hypothetical protein [Bradyrhizobium sp. G127]|uniref:hypothetical protein n=1 Tax=Bradyrhizobium sp. G127 TaxID=2904800 RepID=UPI001F328CFF|nr:hypothetical protein [Bradyrhizobium sp. G127]MCF2524229.1 hypothetical protein [Bradyrhizobium sp. G127]